MQIKVMFEKKWTEAEIQHYMTASEDTKFEDYPPYDRMELHALADIRKEYPDVDLETLKQMVCFAIEAALEDNFFEAYEKYVPFHEVGFSLQRIIENSKHDKR